MLAAGPPNRAGDCAEWCSLGFARDQVDRGEYQRDRGCPSTMLGMTDGRAERCLEKPSAKARGVCIPPALASVQVVGYSLHFVGGSDASGNA
jgi:hypothetical protein